MDTEPAPDVVARIDALLPQTQCTRCVYPGCRRGASAIVTGDAEINQCPPGGAASHSRFRPIVRSHVCRSIPSTGGVAAAGGLDRRGALHRLRTMPAAVSRRRHRRRGEVHAHRPRRALHRLRAVHPALPGGLHRNASASLPQAPSGQAPLVACYQAHSERLLRRALDRQRELDTPAAKKASLPGAPPPGSEGSRFPGERREARRESLPVFRKPTPKPSARNCGTAHRLSY